MRTITLTFQDGSQHVYNNVPDTVTPDQIQARAAQEFNKPIADINGGRPAVSRETQAPEDKGVLQNLGMGALKGAADIGATAMYIPDVLGMTNKTPEQRRADLSQFFQEHANPESLSFGAGELGADIAGTAGAGGLIAKPLMAAGKLIPAAANLGRAVEAGGLAGEGMGTRLAGGAITGGAMAGAVNPKDATTGAMIGGAFPGLGKVAGKVGEKVGETLSASPEVQALAEKARAMGVKVPLDRLLNSPALNAMAASLKYVPFSGRTQTEHQMEKSLQRALSKTFGQDSENITMALRNAREKLGAQFDSTLKNNAVKLDENFLNDASATLQKAQDELSDNEYKIIQKQVDNILGKAQNGVVDGQAAYNIKKVLDRIGGRNTNEAWYANQLKKDLMGALNRSLGPDKAEEFAQVRQHYGNMLDLEPLAKAGAEGDISVARLANMRGIRNPEMRDIADVAAQFVKGRENPHGAMQRIMIGGLAGTGGLGYGAATGDYSNPVTALLLGAAGGRALNTALNNRLAEKMLISGGSRSAKLADLLRNPALRAAVISGGE